MLGTEARVGWHAKTAQDMHDRALARICAVMEQETANLLAESCERLACEQAIACLRDRIGCGPRLVRPSRS